jgi:hypothetical protein
MRQLLACPFCRQLFERAEATECPDCEIPLSPLARLPPSFSSVEEDAVRWEATSPDDQPRALSELGRGRGVLLLIALTSLWAFAFTPWMQVTSPYAELRTGYSLCRGPLAWLWGGAIAWFSTLAVVASRRSVNQMRGVRIILMLFASMTWSEILMLMASSPRGSRLVHFSYTWSWGVYLALALSVAGTIAAARFGGPADLSRRRASAEKGKTPAAGEGNTEAAADQNAAPSSTSNVH